MPAPDEPNEPDDFVRALIRRQDEDNNRARDKWIAIIGDISLMEKDLEKRLEKIQEEIPGVVDAFVAAVDAMQKLAEKFGPDQNSFVEETRERYSAALIGLSDQAQNLVLRIQKTLDLLSKPTDGEDGSGGGMRGGPGQ